MNNENNNQSSPTRDELYFNGMFSLFFLVLWVVSAWQNQFSSRYFIFGTLSGIGCGLLFIGSRMLDFDVTTWTVREEAKKGWAYAPFWSALAPYGITVGLVIGSILQIFITDFLADTITGFQICFMIIFLWISIEYFQHFSQQ